MKSLSGLGLGLSLVFGCLLFALVAELYYLLWWKKKRISSKRESGEEIEDGKTKGLFHHKSCWRNPSLSSPSSSTTLRSETQVHEPTTVQFHGENGDSSKEFWYKPFGENGDGEEEEEEDDDDELMRLQNMGGGGLPRFLFTIKEETKEEMMESEEDGKSSRDRSRKGSRSRSLSDLFHVMEITTTNTPYLTPIASPPYFTPPLTPIRTANTETAMAAEFNWLSSCSSFSPPPNFQFLRDAEKKHHGRKLSDELEIVDRKGVFREDEINGSFITLLVARRNREEEQHSPTTSQVLPLSSSPPSPPPTAEKPKLTTSSSSSSCSTSKSHHIPFPSFSRNSIK